MPSRHLFVRHQQDMFADQYGTEMQDFWGVYEWQSRGSVHLHCLVWFNNVPKAPISDVLGKLKRAMAEAQQEMGVQQIDDPQANVLMRQVLDQDEELSSALQEWCDYYDQYITAVNPAIIPGVANGEELPYDDPYYNNPAVERLPKLDKHICRHAAGDLPPDRDFKSFGEFLQPSHKMPPWCVPQTDKEWRREMQGGCSMGDLGAGSYCGPQQEV